VEKSEIISSHDNTIKIWNAQTGKCKIVLHNPNPSFTNLSKLSYCYDDMRSEGLISGTWYSDVRLWNMNTGEV